MISKKAAGVVLTSKGAVILCKRIVLYKGKKVPFGGYWSPFTGIIEQGETPKETAVRELKEESGVTVREGDLKKIGHIISKTRDLILYSIELEEFPDINLCEEHTDKGYFQIDSLKILPQEYKIDSKIIECIQK